MKQKQYSQVLIGAFFLFSLTLLVHHESIAQTRYWSTGRGITGLRVGRTNPNTNIQNQNVKQISTESRELKESPTESNDFISSEHDFTLESEIRAQLNPDFNMNQEEKIEGVNVEIFIDRQTDLRAKVFSAQSGLTYREILYRFMRAGQEEYFNNPSLQKAP